jgi:hypothetical protein
MIYASMWGCDDEVCDCHQPMVELLTPNTNAGAGRPWIRRTTLWAGTFVSGPDAGEWNSLHAELAEAATRFNVTLSDDGVGWRTETPAVV